MKKILFIFLVLLLTQFTSVLAQESSESALITSRYNKLSQEDIYVHINSSVLFAGEYLFYKVYCINTSTTKLSIISKIAYVELIGENGQPIFKHKIELSDGLGNSNFFVPTSVPSGSYKLVAYTRWMRNLGPAYFFQMGIGVINPYMQNQEAILADSKIEPSTPSVDRSSTIIVSENTRTMGLYLTNEKFGQREEVKFSFKNFKGRAGYGNYSISVKKIDEISNVLNLKNIRSNAVLYDETTGNVNGKRKILYAPESSGSIVSGKVINSKSGLPSGEQNVAISISGKDFVFRGKSTDEAGNFMFLLDADYENKEVVLQVLGESKNDYKIVMDEDEEVDYSSLTFRPLQISSSLKEAIRERSIYNQIENAYYSIKPDTIKTIKFRKPFTYYEEKTEYNLDEFTRFSTMKEVFTELIKHAWTGTDKNGGAVVKVRNYEYNKETDFLPLVFIDGVFVQDHEHLLSYNARKVQKVSVLRIQYFFGSQHYQGVILVETIMGDYKNKLEGDFLTTLNLLQPRQIKTYFNQTYSAGTNDLDKRTPDYRSQLYWEPDVQMTSNEMNFKFYTSDNLGQYEISLEGFSIDGKSVSLRHMFTVE